MNKGFVFLLCCLVFSALKAQESKRNWGDMTIDIIELTTTDVTNIKKFNPDRISILGVSLGMDFQEVKTLFEHSDKARIKQDIFHNERLYLMHPDTSRDVSFGYFIWEDLKGPLKAIVIYDDFRDLLKGETKALLTENAFDFSSAIVRDFLGYPAKKEVVFEVKEIDLKLTTYYYPQKRLQIFRLNQGDDASFFFSLSQDDFDLQYDDLK